MAKQIQKDKSTKKTKRDESLSLELINYRIILAGVVIIVAGYFALSAQPWDNPIALTVAPILLVLGYCVVIPIGIIFRRKKNDVTTAETIQQ
ncbi:MAG: hypothetical protein Q8L88_09910 [Bacteroidota bacterium]|nr:hypothetical protein [Bacteroidota bacterium]